MAGTEKDETLTERAFARLKEQEAFAAEEERSRTAERRLQRQQGLRAEIKRVLGSDAPVEGDRVRIDGLLFAWGRPDDSYSSGLYLLRHCSRCGREVCPYLLEGYDADEGLLALAKALGSPAAPCMGCYYELEEAQNTHEGVAAEGSAAGSSGPEREMTHRELEKWVGELAGRIEELESRIDDGLAAVEEVQEAQERSARQQRESRQAMQDKISNLEFDAWEAQRQASKAARGW